MFVDPDGRDLTGSSGTAGATLSEEDRRKLQQELRRAAPGTTVDAQGNVHRPHFFRRLFNHLTGHGAGTDLVSRLVKQEHTTNIVVTTSGVNKEFAQDNAAAADPNRGSNATVYWNPNSQPLIETRTPDGGIQALNRPAVIGLFHELIHADHDTRGTQEFSATVGLPYFGVHDFTEGNTMHREQSTRNEFRTVGFAGFTHRGDITENQIRRELGQLPRAASSARKFWDY